jgi:peptide/nickel transport system substrate-binding protein
MSSGRPFTRRKLIVSTATSAGAVAAVAAGVSADESHGGHGGTSPSNLLRAQGANIPTPREQTVIISQSIVQVWDSFNPYIPNGESYQYGVNQLCREAMFYVNFPKGEIINQLATGYTYNADFTEFTLNLTPEANWSDGQPFSADDVVFSLELIKANTQFRGSPEANEFVDTVTASDPKTVVFKLKKAQPRFHYYFTIGIVDDRFRIVPKHVWDGQDAGTFKNNPPVYTGPYVLNQANPDQLMQVWEKAPNYWNKANMDPAPQYVIFRQRLEPDAEAQEFANGNVDIPSLPYLNMQAVRDQFDNWTELDFNDPCPRGIWLNADSPSGLFKTPEGRWAISYLLDRETIGNTIWQPPSKPALYPWAEWGIHDRWTNEDIRAEHPFEYNPERAAELLDAAGAVLDGDIRKINGQEINLSIITPTNPGDSEYQIGVLLADALKDVGINAEVKPLPGSGWPDAWQLGEYDISSHWLCGVALDPNQLYEKFLIRDYKPVGERPTADHNETRTQDQPLSDVAEQLQGVNPDDEANKPLFDQGLAAYLTALPAMPSIYTIYPFAFSTQYWTGWPTQEDEYQVSANWWAQFLFVIGAIKPATAS